MSKYPELENLIGAWFHQDFDLDGDTTLEQIIAAYRAVTPRDRQRALIGDIQRFLAEPGDVETKFQDQFKPDIIPSGFASSTRAFLVRIAELVNE